MHYSRHGENIDDFLIRAMSCLRFPEPIDLTVEDLGSQVPWLRGRATWISSSPERLVDVPLAFVPVATVLGTQEMMPNPNGPLSPMLGSFSYKATGITEEYVVEVDEDSI